MVAAGLILVVILIAFIGVVFVSAIGSFLDKGGIIFEVQKDEESDS